MLITMPVPQPVLRDSVLELCKANNHLSGYIRLTVTRGTGLGLDPKHIQGTANVYISTEQLSLYPAELYETGLKMITASNRLPGPDVIDPRIKCTGKYTNNIQAKLEANRKGAGEAVMLNAAGYVCECTGDNIFVFKNGILKTPPPHSCGLVGITRNTVLELARKDGTPIDETLMTQYDVYNADECFLTGTGAEVIPAIELDARTIGSGRAGALTKRFIGLFREHTQESGVKF
jgi:branched-chain amino acid aminotransferase